jgi:hypothetical protein
MEGNKWNFVFDGGDLQIYLLRFGGRWCTIHNKGRANDILIYRCVIKPLYSFPDFLAF